MDADDFFVADGLFFTGLCRAVSLHLDKGWVLVALSKGDEVLQEELGVDLMDGTFSLLSCTSNLRLDRGQLLEVHAVSLSSSLPSSHRDKPLLTVHCFSTTVFRM